MSGALPTFSGKPETLEDVLTNVEMDFLVKETDPAIPLPDRVKCGLLAGRYRGSALTWLTAHIRGNPGWTGNYDLFKRVTRAAFAPSNAAAMQEAARRYSSARQTKSVQEYFIYFVGVANRLEIPEEARIHQFIRGLKKQTRIAMLSNGEDYDSVLDAKRDAERIDAGLQGLTQSPGGNYKSKLPRPKGLKKERGTPTD